MKTKNSLKVNKRKPRQQYPKSRFSGDKTAPLAVSFHHA